MCVSSFCKNFNYQIFPTLNDKRPNCWHHYFLLPWPTLPSLWVLHVRVSRRDVSGFLVYILLLVELRTLSIRLRVPVVGPRNCILCDCHLHSPHSFWRIESSNMNTRKICTSPDIVNGRESSFQITFKWVMQLKWSYVFVCFLYCSVSVLLKNHYRFESWRLCYLW